MSKNRAARKRYKAKRRAANPRSLNVEESAALLRAVLAVAPACATPTVVAERILRWTSGVFWRNQPAIRRADAVLEIYK